jgi:hypothetical protein
MKENISPEEKLLEIIRKGNDVSPHKSVSPERMAFLSIALSLRKIIKSIPFNTWLPAIIISLFVFSIVLLLLSFIFAFLPPGSKQLSLVQDKEMLVESATNEILPPSVEAYIEVIRKKDIFNSASFMKDGKPDSAIDGLKNIWLLGIITEEPKQAIIKDKTKEEIYYLKEGESLGEFKVSQILDGKIVVEYRGEGFEIHL